ncbi:hypothetical protein B0H63DRAFT_510519 [Podospora didyma]|uniref:Uncharacterized protein n=1 Tax=Podospora didyma TaxID=330526 RepID=A0AAE0NQX5_9PEZI|nr:hypothetical protein B0H63DRAFT_510519 [Podospora didyma]
MSSERILLVKPPAKVVRGVLQRQEDFRFEHERSNPSRRESRTWAAENILDPETNIFDTRDFVLSMHRRAGGSPDVLIDEAFGLYVQFINAHPIFLLEPNEPEVVTFFPCWGDDLHQSNRRVAHYRMRQFLHAMRHGNVDYAKDWINFSHDDVVAHRFDYYKWAREHRLDFDELVRYQHSSPDDWEPVFGPEDTSLAIRNPNNGELIPGYNPYMNWNTSQNVLALASETDTDEDQELREVDRRQNDDPFALNNLSRHVMAW